jgi:hypothetical protein
MNKLFLFPVFILCCVIGCNNTNKPMHPIIGAWQLDSLSKNGADNTSAFLTNFPGYTIYFADNGSVKSSYTNTATNNLQITFGVFELMDNETKVKVSFSGAAIQIADIHRLDETTLQYGYQESGDTILCKYKRRQ